MNLPSLNSNELVDINSDNAVSQYIRGALARYFSIKDIPYECILFTNGADAAIHTLVRTILKDKNVTYLDLNYHYATQLITENARIATEQKTFWDVCSGVRKFLLPGLSNPTDILYITNPDNKLGLYLNSNELIHIVNKSNLCIIDESYGDYVPISLIQQALHKKNTIILRTFSKFFSLETERIGYIISNKKTIQILREALPQYPIATTSIFTLLNTLKVTNITETKKKRAQIEKKKKMFYTVCDKNDILYAHSHTNFVTIFDRNPETIPAITFLKKDMKEFILHKKKCFRLCIERVTFL
ncbi:MAG: aminotransferase class I/II-fold pyridoxal phosphate-dependent enzyme [Candidatus Moranbacteria bacterium]|nr:aminotransferase class I/II-fold pyridoxal phosphate-dependent enzyme [Candidatus Moranbacteria bacterium]MDD3964820.1 aminotransferase class I/II-fold pyridoxal phosphate-dependent enzyme [Candidatus Moranbacteria bacterium]